MVNLAVKIGGKTFLKRGNIQFTCLSDPLTRQILPKLRCQRQWNVICFSNFLQKFWLLNASMLNLEDFFCFEKTVIFTFTLFSWCWESRRRWWKHQYCRFRRWSFNVRSFRFWWRNLKITAWIWYIFSKILIDNRQIRENKFIVFWIYLFFKG